MTVVHVEQGYLQAPYQQTEYLTMHVIGGMGTQFQAVINYEVALGAQLQGVISKAHSIGVELESVIQGYKLSALQYESNILDRLSALGTQFNSTVLDYLKSTGLQFNSYVGGLSGFGQQFQGMIAGAKANGAQFESHIIDRLNSLAIELEALISTTHGIGVQFQGVITGTKASGTQFNSEPFEKHPSGVQFEGQINDRTSGLANQFISAPYVHIWAGYLVEEYLTAPYLLKRFTVHCGLQFEAKNINEESGLGFQFTGVIQGYKATGTQFTGVVTKYTGTGVQFDSVNPSPIGIQFRAALYNTDNLRILCDFPSRGTGGGTNWTASSTAAGDFNVSNVNTDIVEQVWRSQTGTITGVQLTCDTGLPQGVFLDTLAILNHNLTTSAAVLLEGDDDPGFGSPGFSETLQISADNTYWIAPDLPLSGYRYWRFSIDDPTNTEGYLEIGTIIFGESVIFVGECFSNPVRMKKKHFSDKVYTEGFTNVGNDRTFKKSIGLTFQNLNISGGNYQNITEIFETSRTNLKCLWVPTPKYPDRYAVFGKLTELPDEEHNDLGSNADYVNFTVEVDESL